MKINNFKQQFSYYIEVVSVWFIQLHLLLRVKVQVCRSQLEIGLPPYYWSQIPRLLAVIQGPQYT